MKTITRKALKSSRFHMLNSLRHHGHAITIYTRKVSTVVSDAVESVSSVVEAIASTTLTLWQRITAFVRRLFGKAVTV
jgi:hypothetical protein